MFPACAETRCQLHAVIQPIDLRQAQPERAVQILVTLPVDFQCRRAALFREAVALVALVANACEWLEADVAASQVVADLGEGLLCIGVVTTFRAVAEPIEADFTFVAAVVVAERRTQPQRYRAALAQGVGAQVPAVEVAVELATVHTSRRFAADHAQMPMLTDAPVSAQYQAFSRIFQVLKVAIKLPSMAQRL
ncbi:hypothetical protein D3C87_1344510 [compost metagenome]